VFAGRQLAARRRAEAEDALDVLRVRPERVHHLGLPDGALAGCTTALRDALDPLVRPGDVVLAPWADDGHPDHEAVGRVATDLGSTCWQFPVWMWHWAQPADPRIPWQRFRRTSVPDVALKAAAVAQFATQVLPIGAEPADAAILPPHVLARFLRPAEWIVT
jgi:LmbE family N-acetylglucosaminyl deacetylase